VKLFLFFGLLVHAVIAFGAPVSISVLSEISISPNPLTSELVSRLDPLEPNPAFVRYFIERKVRIESLNSEKPLLVSEVIIHLRPNGSLFKDISEFPCDLKQPDPRFATRDGVIQVAYQGSEIWAKILNENLHSLALKLRPNDPARSMKALQDWLVYAEKIYWNRFESKKAQIELDTYRKLAKNACKKDGSASLSFDSLLEKSVEQEYLDPYLIARAPAQRVLGYFTVRGTIQLGTQQLNGRFLIDPSADGNALSSEWLKSQGMDLRPIYSGKKTIKKVRFSSGSVDQNKTTTIVGQTIEFSDFGFGGKILGPIEFVLGETEVFFEPKAEKDCCDGVIGIPFLRQFVVEFLAHEYSSIGFYRPEGFPHPKGAIMTSLWFRDPQSLSKTAKQIQKSNFETVWIDRMHGRIFIRKSRQSKPIVTL
jgi:hypothetical protein